MKTALIAGITVLVLPIVFIVIGYYLDYKHDKKSFIKGAKGVLAALFLVGSSFFLQDIATNALSSIFPANSNHDKAYNAFRLAKGIPVIENSWKVWSYAGNGYEVWWADSLNTDANIHTFKIIKYNLWGPVSEFDYFESEDSDFRLETGYYYSNDTLIYTKISSKGASSKYPSGGTSQDNLHETAAPISQEEFNNLLSELKAGCLPENRNPSGTESP